jgi:hypothetical protein
MMHEKVYRAVLDIVGVYAKTEVEARRRALAYCWQRSRRI